MKGIKLCYSNCRFLKPKEHEQKENDRPYLGHWCLRHSCLLEHGRLHPSIVAHKNCTHRKAFVIGDKL